MQKQISREQFGDEENKRQDKTRHSTYARTHTIPISQKSIQRTRCYSTFWIMARTTTRHYHNGFGVSSRDGCMQRNLGGRPVV
jgi:hypothetical protein